jgi:general secretion pathway protein A
LKSTPEPDDTLSPLKRRVATAPDTQTSADTDIKSALAAIDAAMARSAAAEQEDAPAPPVITPFARGERAPQAEPERHTPVATRKPEPSVQPIASGAEYRSRLNWFIGVADVSAQDPGSLTYEPFFGLREKPFSLSADPRFFYSRASHGAAFDTLAAGIRRREGVLVLSGEVGTGKTTLCRAVLESLDQKTFAAFVPDPFLSREDLLKTLLVDFGVVSLQEMRSGRLRGASRADLSYPLYEFLGSLQPLRAFAVVMIDEAQNLKAELLEEIRALSDLENGQKLLEVVLVGQPELQSRLTTNEMRQLSQRVSIRCELAPLVPEEVESYIWHRLRIAGHDGRIQFASDAMALIAGASSGIPRLINLICDRVLLEAARARETMVNSQYVSVAVAELKLPITSATILPQLAAAAIPLASTLAPLSLPTPSTSVDLVPDASLNLFPQEALPEPTTGGNDVEPSMAPPPSPEPVAEPVFPQSGRLVRAKKLPPLPPPIDRSADDTFSSGASKSEPAETTTVAAPPPPHRARWLAAVCVVLAAVATGVVGSRYPRRPAQPREPSVEEPARNSSPPPVAAPEPPPAPASADLSRFAVQIATFRTSLRAEQAVRELRQGGYEAYSTEKVLRDGSTVFTVLLGPYAERTDAERDRTKQIPGYETGLLIDLAPTPPSAPSATSQK